MARGPIEGNGEFVAKTPRFVIAHRQGSETTAAKAMSQDAKEADYNYAE
jgi:hypothetical protein